MAIRMERDEPQKPRQDPKPPRDRREGGGGGGGAGLLMFLPILFKLFGRNPRSLIFILLIGGAFYFMMGDGCGSAMLDNNADSSNFPTLGLDFNQEKYDATEVFEPLADNSKNPLPERFSLERYAPKRMNQGRQGSCVGWASSYAARTILHAQATGNDPNRSTFSPAFLYNQIALRDCQGAYMQDAMESMRQKGLLPFGEFKYDETSCSRKPNRSELADASAFRTKGYNRLTKGGNNYKVDMLAIKQNLAQGAPVVIGMQVGGSFMQSMEGRKIWIPNKRDYNLTGFSGHAMCVIGYDDYLTPNQGGFQIMNSWGERWGDRGIAWVRYEDFDYFVKEAFGLYPMGRADANNSTSLSVKFGLVDNKSKQNIGFRQVSGNVFRTTSPIRIGDKFKAEVTNSIECYIYVFSEEADGKSTVLFPYTKKHSPYCGITGTRLFPKDYSMTPDNVGSQDKIAILVTKNPVDYNKVNAAINKTQGGFAYKVNTVLGAETLQNAVFKAGKTVDLAIDTRGKNGVAVILEIDKQ